MPWNTCFRWGNKHAMLWEVDIYPASGHADPEAARIRADAAAFGLSADLPLHTARGFLIQGDLDRSAIDRLGRELLADDIVQRTIIGPPNAPEIQQPPHADTPQLVYVLPKPGVMDPVAQSTLAAIADFGYQAEAVRTFRKYWFAADLSAAQLRLLCQKLLANDAIEQVIIGPLPFAQLELGSPYTFQLQTVSLRDLDDNALSKLSKQGQLYLSLAEMQTIQRHFRELGREPTDIELETVAQTWSEHCSHKTLAGRIHYVDEHGEQQFQNMLKETIFAATVEIRKRLGADDWCVSVFKDNAGIVKFDDEYNVVFKVETHNHPSALEPYGGANTGLGGVIRDPLGTGMGAKPIANTDIFCFAPPDIPAADLPPGVLHPKRVMRGVVSGVRDYGNRMGIPTVNGAVYFDRRYLGNPLVYCGNVGIIPCDKSDKQPLPHDYIVAVGGRTGRDGIHGATFSSAELTQESESLSGGAVQIGNAITEKMVLDVLLAARDQGLYHAITDCGAGGFSSAVGEMGEEIGAEVWLDRCPLKYEGLSYTEIWISEAQERMILAVPPEKWDELSALCAAEGVEATVIGTFAPTGRLVLKYRDEQVGDLPMSFLHDGRPPVIREAVYQPPPETPLPIPENRDENYTADLLAILGSLNVCSKEWIIRQYDHEVQGGSVVKPLVGVANDGPSDGGVLRPRLNSRRGLVLSCGMNPHYGDYDTYHMAASAMDEALRNCVALGADPRRVAVLDNFCWGNTERPETLGSLVRAALACREIAVAWGTPFISGKDSLNNEFSYLDPSGKRQTIAIPPSLLISALGQVADVSRCVTMDLKQSGNFLYQVGPTSAELGGSHFSLIHGLRGGSVPRVNIERAHRTFLALHAAIQAGLVRSCHDLSEGGLAVAAAEMCLAGGLGARLFLNQVPHILSPADPSLVPTLLFSESNSRFLCEVPAEHSSSFEHHLSTLPHHLIGEVVDSGLLQIVGLPHAPSSPTADTPSSPTAPLVLEARLSALKHAWQSPLRW